VRSDYVIKRVLFALVTVWVAITLNFLLFRTLPGNAVSALRCRACTEQFKKAQIKELGLDESTWTQYKLYVEDLAHGNLGNSLTTEGPVWDEIKPALKNTLPMIMLGTGFSIIFGILAGVIASWRRGTWVDRGNMWVSLAFYSMPPQWLGLMLIFFVATAVGLPQSGLASPDLGVLSEPSFAAYWSDRLQHMILPALTLGLVLYGDYTLIVRSAMLETLGEDYVLTARAKGLSNWAIVWKHGLRNALLPIVTLVALSLGFIIGGTFTIEYVFSYPGVGYETVQAIDRRDYPVLQGIFLLLTMSVILFNLIADLLYFKLDPRVTS
jgi:ABC-type dipeptide/oligopeptide/nickel transport system permease component